MLTEPIRPEDCATAWFAVLERAFIDRDTERIIEAQRHLNRLGVAVKFRSPQQTCKEECDE